jgi:signal transduction histidine kinase
MAKGGMILCFGLLLLGVPDALLAQQKNEANVYWGEYLELLEGEWDQNPALEVLMGAPAIRLEKNVPNVASDGAWHWLKLEMPPGELREKWMEVATSSVDSLVVISTCSGVVRTRFTAHGSGTRWSSDVGIPVKNNSLDGSNYPVFAVTEDCTSPTIYLGVKSGKQLVLPLRFNTKATIQKWTVKRDLFFSMYLGIMLVMFLYNLILYFTVEDRTYLLYVLFLIGVAGSQLFLEGYQGLIPGFSPTSWLGSRVVHFMGIYSGVTTILFVNRFLDLERTGRGYYLTFNFLFGGYLLAFAAVVFGELNVGYQMINGVALGAVLVLPASIHVWRQGRQSALFLLTAFSLFFASVVVFSLKEFGVIAHQTMTKFAMPLGSMVEVVLLSIALADRINQLKKESALAREEQLRISLLNEKITREQNEALERRVKQRTEELEERNERLRGALDELKLAQDQLVQSEKLASIGQLTAGIAHELNNPINFVSSSAQSLRRDFEDVSEVLVVLQGLASEDADLAVRVADMQQRIQELDLEFTLKEIDELLTGIEDGSNRTAEIVKGLRIFSRMDGDEATEANLNDLLESTLVILRSTLRDEVELVVDLASNVPSVSCQPGKLNQVFMNLITNAAQATSKTELPKENRQVRVRTRVVTEEGLEWVQVAVEDNGIGMTEEVKSQIFDPFFTTKEVGEGTGLGLSIVKGILDDHKATLDIQSNPGQGSLFLITFPT